MPIINSVIAGGGTTPTGTIQITTNGTHDVTNYANADVQVPTTAPEIYRVFRNNNGVLENSVDTPFLQLPSSITSINNYVLNSAYKNTPSNVLYGDIDLSNITTIGQYSCQGMFSGCTGITSVDLSSLTSANNYGCQEMFSGCTGITSVDLSSLTNIHGYNSYAFGSMFYNCTGLTSVTWPVEVVSYQNGCDSMFRNCTSLTSIDLSSLYAATGNGCFSNAFAYCTGLTSVDLSGLVNVYQNTLSAMFYGCTSLASVDMSGLIRLPTSAFGNFMFYNCPITELRFSNLPYTATNLNNAFQGLLNGVTGCTVHFPAEWETTMASWSNITNGLGGTNTTVLFDLPNVTTINLSHIKHLSSQSIPGVIDNSNYFPNATSVDMSGVVTITGDSACKQMFNDTTVITSADLSSLTTINARQACMSMFQGCTGLTSVDLSSLTTVGGDSSCSAMFRDCTGLTSVDLSGLTTISSTSACSAMFQGCTGLTSVDLSGLENVSGQYPCGSMFKNCTSLTTLSFPSLKTVTDSYVFNNIVDGCNGVTIHFPSNMSSYNFPVGGTNTTVLYDLPATE